MDRLACVDLAAFPLQLLVRKHPEWRGLPTVVVSEDRPQGVVSWASEEARRARVLPGQRYASALSLAADLRAGVMSDREIARGVDALGEELRRFSPVVDPCAEQPGVFWLDASGLERLYGSLHHWGRAVARTLDDQGWRASLVVGFSRFSTYAVARARKRGLTVFDDEPTERATARDVPLELLDVSPRLRDALHRLGITTVGGFVRLPAGGILQRFGKAAHHLHRLAAGEGWDPLRPKPPPDPATRTILFDTPETDSTRLLFAVKRGLDAVLAKLADRRHAVAELQLDFRYKRSAVLDGDRPGARRDRIRPAEPTLDARVLLRLVHLRLEGKPPEAGVDELVISVAEIPATSEQLALFAQKPRRDLGAADEALAQLRAELGNDAVLRAELRDGHLPEARYAWRPASRVRLPVPRSPGPEKRPLVRRIRARPRMLPPQEHRYRDDGWLLGSLEQGPVTNVVGPYVVSGGWWVNEIHREYHFAETRRGDCLWVYYDRRRRRWFLQGQVE